MKEPASNFERYRCIPVLGMLLLALFLPLPLQAQERMFHSGTGFFIAHDGDVITNHHVIQNCASDVWIRSGDKPPAKVRVTAADQAHDLALLRAEDKAPYIAPLRYHDTTRLEIGEPILVMGYPGESALSGEYKIARSAITAMKGPHNETHWIQFDDSAQKGNSGGPLLDSSGNVAGVVVGSFNWFWKAADGSTQAIAKSDVAISLAVLRRFLDVHGVKYRLSGSHLPVPPKDIERHAQNYIVSVICPSR